MGAGGPWAGERGILHPQGSGRGGDAGGAAPRGGLAVAGRGSQGAAPCAGLEGARQPHGGVWGGTGWQQACSLPAAQILLSTAAFFPSSSSPSPPPSLSSPSPSPFPSSSPSLYYYYYMKWSRKNKIYPQNAQ